MTKKLLFGMMSLAMLAACTSDEIESFEVAEGNGNVQFVVMNNDAETRASIKDNAVIFSAKDGDLFTLYHGATANYVTGFQNATYKASEDNGVAVLTTPSMILPGQAIMVYPADTAFTIKSDDVLTIQIPEELEDAAKSLPYVSDGINIGAYNGTTAADNTAGYERNYPIFMRPMASQLNLKTDYEGMEDIEALYEGKEGVATGEGIEEIKVTAISVSTNASGSTKFTQKIKLTLPSGDNPAWTDASSNRVKGNNWNAQTSFDDLSQDATFVQSVAKLTSKSLNENDGCKLLFLPQKSITVSNAGEGVAKCAITVETQYGKVFIGEGGSYTDDELKKAWYRYTSTAVTAGTTYETSTATSDGNYKTWSYPATGLAQTLNFFATKKAAANAPYIAGEQVGAVVERYVVVNLAHLDMSELHIQDDKQLQDVVRVWKKLGLGAVTVYLDGNDDKEFVMTQKTIKLINTVNNGTLNFKVQPCKGVTGHNQVNTIVITGSDEIQEVQDIAFIAKNTTASHAVNVALADEGKDTPWLWKGTVKATNLANNGINWIINRGTMENSETATLAVYLNNGTTQTNIRLVNNGTWNITEGTLNVQFNVVNNGVVNISKGAQYRQDGNNAKKTFTNDATNKPTRFGGDDSKIGVVNNKGVFATVGQGEINNYGLIEHADKDAKTYITTNQDGGVFGTAFGASNKMGTINLPYSNKEEDNISISAALTQGFVSVTVKDNGENLDASIVGPRVNYINVVGGVKTISAVSEQVKYLEINQPGTEVVWAVTDPTKYDGLMILSDVNISLDATIASVVTYLGADMYVGGVFNNVELNTVDFDGDGTADTTAATKWSGYFGNTSANVATKYITF